MTQPNPTKNATVQFRIDRPPNGKVNGINFPLPVAVWVYWPSERATSYSCRCSKTIYRLVEDEAFSLIQAGVPIVKQEKVIENPSPDNIFVCPCMGEIIE